MMKLFFNTCLLVFIFPLFLLTSCAPEEPEQDPVIYSGSGSYWDVTVEISREDERFLVSYTYNRDLEDLREMSLLQFGIGLKLGTYGIIFLDESLDKGDSFDISFLDFKNIDSTTFDISFPDLTNQYTIKDIHHAIELDGLIIDMSWNNDRKDNRDRIDISCCE